MVFCIGLILLVFRFNNVDEESKHQLDENDVNVVDGVASLNLSACIQLSFLYYFETLVNFYRLLKLSGMTIHNKHNMKGETYTSKVSRTM